MLFRPVTITLLGSIAFCGEAFARSVRDSGNLSGLLKRAESTCLNPALIQSASDSTGQTGVTEPGQIASKTDAANFINFCEGKTITNGSQQTGGSCNGVVMGNIPSTENMISAIITSPLPGDVIPANTTFTIKIQTQGLAAGNFVNAETSYYSAPQDLDSTGRIIGHTHVTVQDLGPNMFPITPLDPTKFAFFLGVNDAGNGQGLLNATVTGGLAPGFYRVCTMMAAANHQPVMMPVAKRGAQDDCTKFQVVPAAANSCSSSATVTVTAASSASSVSIVIGPSVCSVTSVTTTVTASAATATAAASSGAVAAVVVSGTLGAAADPVTNSGDPSRPFEVNNNTFTSAADAVQRSCDIQFNQCADAFNSGNLPGHTLGDCQTQQSNCHLGSG